MGSTNKLLFSWNFNTVTGSDSSGGFLVQDTSGVNNGTASYFTPNSSNFVSKKDIWTSKKVLIENLATEDTINLVSEDDMRIDIKHNPSSLNLIAEKSMYQILSDDMMNVFSTLEQYSSKFANSNNKYKEIYPDLVKSSREYFSQVLGKANLEKYLEFYRWIDSSLSYMLEQLKPETSNNIAGLKNTIESHILERSKYTHKIPLVIDTRKPLNTNIKIIGDSTISSNVSDDGYYEADIPSGINISNIANKNFFKNHEIIQSAGKIFNNRDSKLKNKTIIQTKFSSVDGNSDNVRDESGEYSIYNSLLNKSSNDIRQYNLTESATKRYTQGLEADYMDNQFLLRNIPYTSSNYYNTGAQDYQAFPSPEVLFRHRTNLLIDESADTYEDSYDIVEPAIEFNIPVSHRIKLKDYENPINILSSYDNQINTFTEKNRAKDSNKLEKIYLPATEGEKNFKKETFYEKAKEMSGSLFIERVEKLNTIYPRQDKIGLADIRTRARYEEIVGNARDDYYSIPNLRLRSISIDRKLPWTNDSYNNPTTEIRTFWRDNFVDRRRTRGLEANPGTAQRGLGSFNCFWYTNVSQSLITSNYYYDENLYNSLYCMDGDVDVQFSEYDTNVIVSCSNEQKGDLSPYSHFYQRRLLSNNTFVQPKPSFVHNLFLSKTLIPSDKDVEYVFNKSYSSGIDCKIRPFYDSYEGFRLGIKNRSQSYSIVPEFMVSNHRNLINNKYVPLYRTIAVDTTGKSITTPTYLKTNGVERANYIRNENFKVDLNKFINKDTNKIKIKIKAVKKLLPYNGFYPNQRSVQIAGLFNDVYLHDSTVVNGVIRSSTQPNIIQNFNLGVGKTLSATQPFFAPGILFNTIKSGMAVDWPIVTSSVEDDIYYVQSGGSKVTSLKTISTRMPFESLIDPGYYFNQLSKIKPVLEIPYLDPTHYAKYATYDKVNENKKVNDLQSLNQEDIRILFNTPTKHLYRSAINNFLSEITYFFMNNGELTNISSRGVTSKFAVSSGSVYVMDLVVKKSPTFSMFNEQVSGNQDYMFIPKESLFGPPVCSTGTPNHTSSMTYYPYIPPYLQNENDCRLRMYYTASTNEIYFDDITKNLKYEVSSRIEHEGKVEYINRMDLRACFNTDLVEYKDEQKWYIQAKFETPLINFSKCSYVLTSSLTHGIKDPLEQG